MSYSFKTMKKKILILTVLVLLTTSSLFASVFQLGPMVSYKQAEPEKYRFFDNFLSVNNFSYGVDTRLNFWLFQVQADAKFNYGKNQEYGTEGKVASSIFGIDTVATANIRLHQSIFELIVGCGVEMDFNKPKEDNWYLGSVSMKDKNPMKGTRLIYRVGGGFNFGLLGITINYLIPAESDFTKFDITPNGTDASLTLSVLFGI